MTEPVDYDRGNTLLQNLIRGDALIGLVADVPAMEKQILSSLWSAASQGYAPAYARIAECAIAALQPIGAFEGIVDDEADSRPWSDDAKKVDAEDPQLQTALRAHFEAHRLGDATSLVRFAKLTRHAPEQQQLAAKLLREKPNPTGEDLYVLGNVLLWLDEQAESAQVQLRAAEAGNLDAKFELSLYYGQASACPSTRRRRRPGSTPPPMRATSARSTTWARRTRLASVVTRPISRSQRSTTSAPPTQVTAARPARWA